MRMTHRREMMNRLNMLETMSEDTLLLAEYEELTDAQRESLNAEFLLADAVRRPCGVRRHGEYRGSWRMRR